ncbi:MAG: serine/threonine-protein kinase, partial [Acidobacteriota bacterium]
GMLGEPLWKLIPKSEARAASASSREGTDRLTPARGRSPAGSVKGGGRAALGEENRIGPYRLKKLLGRGGMGQVHLAVREDDYRQEVALKRTFGPFDSEALMERFVRERQILANLQHPGIARLLDGGTDSAGFPYLVMEYVDGVPIDRYCRDRSLDLPARLQLFLKVCDAVHHAHQNLVVHRDLKPNNILVTREGQPRLLDFGIAKLLEGQAEHQDTGEGGVPLTPACASPEQLLGDAVTTASDVYALGVLLYRLLSGHRPYELENLGFFEMVRLVCLGEDPTLPSLAVLEPPSGTSSAASGGSSAASVRQRLRREISGDLDAIVLKAMHKEPRQRYSSASDLADDVRNHLEGLPVAARRGEKIYQTSRHLSRNRPVLAFLLLALVSAVASTVLWRQAESGRQAAELARREAEFERDRAREMTDFLSSTLLAAEPDRARGADVTVREVVDAATLRVETLRDPAQQSAMFGTLSHVYDSLGLYDRGRELAEEALRTEILNDPRMSLARAGRLVELGRSHYNLGDYRAAERLFQQVYDARSEIALAPEDLEKLLLNLAAVSLFGPNPEKGESLYLEILGDGASSAGAVGSANYGLGAFYMKRGEPHRAVDPLRRSLEFRERSKGARSTPVIRVQDTLAKAYVQLGRHAEALELLGRA